MATFINKAIVKSALTTGYVTYYTVPANTKTIINDFTLTKSVAGAITIYISGVQVYSTTSMAANTIFNIHIPIVLESGDTIYVYSANTYGFLSVTGVEIS